MIWSSPVRLRRTRVTVFVRVVGAAARRPRRSGGGAGGDARCRHRPPRRRRRPARCRRRSRRSSRPRLPRRRSCDGGGRRGDGDGGAPCRHRRPTRRRPSRRRRPRARRRRLRLRRRLGRLLGRLLGASSWPWSSWPSSWRPSSPPSSAGFSSPGASSAGGWAPVASLRGASWPAFFSGFSVGCRGPGRAPPAAASRPALRRRLGGGSSGLGRLLGRGLLRRGLLGGRSSWPRSSSRRPSWRPPSWRSFLAAVFFAGAPSVDGVDSEGASEEVLVSSSGMYCSSTRCLGGRVVIAAARSRAQHQAFMATTPSWCHTESGRSLPRSPALSSGAVTDRPGRVAVWHRRASLQRTSSGRRVVNLWRVSHSRPPVATQFTAAAGRRSRRCRVQRSLGQPGEQGYADRSSP